MIYAIGMTIILLQLVIIYLIYSSVYVTRQKQRTINDNLKTLNSNVVLIDDKLNN